MAGFRLEGNTSGNVAEIDTNHNLNVTQPLDHTFSGYSMLAGTVAEVGSPVGRITQAVRVSAQGRLGVGEPVMLFNEKFNATAVNTAQWFQAAATQTITVAGGTLNLNATGTAVASHHCSVKTYASFPIQADFAIFLLTEATLTQNTQNNCTIEIGFMQALTNAAPTDGAFFRYDPTGTFKAVLNNNGTEYTSEALAIPTPTIMHKYKVVVENDRVIYYVDSVCQAIINAPTGLGMPTMAQSQPVMYRIIHANPAPAIGNTLKVGYTFVGLQDAVGMGKSMAECGAMSGKMGSQGQSGMTMGSTALYGNSLAAGAGVALTNTTAAAGVGLGGQFSILPTLAVPTDGVLCSYQNPAASASVSGKTLYIRGVRIQGAVTTALVGGPVLLAFSLAYGHTSVSLAQAEGAGTKAPRRIPLGYESFGAASAVATLGSPQGVYMPFAAPIAVNAGEFLAVTAKNLGVVTTAGVIAFQVTFDSYWE